jgi:hypothetical protein
VAAGFAVALSIGGCPPTFDATLPANVDASLSVVLHEPDAFAQPAGGTAKVTAGTVVAPLTGAIGCWGAFIPAIAGQGSLGQIDHYGMLQLHADGTVTTWDAENIGGLAAVVIASSGHYQLVADNRLRFTSDSRQDYNPISKSFETHELNPPEVVENLATLDGDLLYLRMLDKPGAPAPGANEPDYTTVYHRFDCVE